MNIWSLDSDGPGAEAKLVTLHSPHSLRTKSSASHVIVSLMAWSSSAMKDEHNNNYVIIIFFPLIFPDVCVYVCMCVCSSFIAEEDHAIREMMT